MTDKDMIELLCKLFVSIKELIGFILILILWLIMMSAFLTVIMFVFFFVLNLLTGGRIFG